MNKATAHLPPLLRPWLACLLLVVGCLYIYQDILGTGFVMFDDDVNFVYNGQLGPLSWERLKWIATEHAVMVRYVPVGWFFCCALTQPNGLDPFWFHAASLALHSTCAVMLYGLLRRLAPKLGIQNSTTSTGRLGGLLPVVLAGWWAWHPLRVETVAWATPMIYLLATALGLAALFLLLESTGTQKANRAHRGLRLGALALFVAALLSHPAALSLLPLYLGALILECPPKAGLRTALKDRDWQMAQVKRAAPFVLAALVALVATMKVREMGSLVQRPGTPSLEQFGVMQRLAQASAVLVHFLEKTLWPGKLNPAYPLLYVVQPQAPFFILSMCAAFGLMMTGLYALLKRLKAGLFGLALLAACMPVLGLNEAPYFPCDRYTYIPAILLTLLMLSIAGQNLISRRLCITFGVPLLAALLPLWLILSYRQTAIWSSTERLYSEVTSIQPEGMARSGYACRAIAEKIDGGKVEEARTLFTELCERLPSDANIQAISAHLTKTEQECGTPSYALMLNVQARAALREGEHGLAEERLRRALAMSPSFEEARFNLGLLLSMRGEPRQALAQYLWLRREGKTLPRQSMDALRTIIATTFRAKGEDRLALRLEQFREPQNK